MVIGYHYHRILDFLVQDMQQFGDGCKGQVSHTFEIITLFQPWTYFLDLFADFHNAAGVLGLLLGIRRYIELIHMLKVFIEAQFNQGLFHEGIFDALLVLIVHILSY